MKVLMINSVCGVGSTGRICTDIAQSLEKEGHICKIAYGRGVVPEKFQKYAIKIGSSLGVNTHAALSRVFDSAGLHSKFATKKFLKWAEEFNPDVLHLHNIHGYYIHIGLLFQWIKSRPNMQVKWTLHDCWAFTGHCAHFTMANCNRWKNVCKQCPQKKKYPSSILFSRAKQNFLYKQKAFTGVQNMRLITPSKWLADLVSESFLKEYPIEVQYNTIDTNIFKPTESDFKKRYGLQDKKIVLGVASVWNESKGLYDFYKIANGLHEDYVVLLVGLTDEQIKSLPKNIIGIRRTNSPQELAEIYTAADVFVNTTYEDNYPTVNLEAQACGTKVITYATGGAPETIYTKESIVVGVGEYQKVVEEIKR